MSIASILSRKGSEVVRVTPQALIKSVIQILGERRIGAVLVMDESRLRGILSERDIVGALARHGTIALDQTASSLMTQVLWTISAEGTIADAMRIMTDHRVRHLPVMEDEVLVGLVSIGDIVKARLDEQATEVESLRAYVGGMH